MNFGLLKFKVILGICMLIMFVYSLKGISTIYSYAYAESDVNYEYSLLEAKKKSILIEIDLLNNKVKDLSETTLNIDVLEAILRSKFNVAKDDEIIIVQ